MGSGSRRHSKRRPGSRREERGEKTRRESESEKEAARRSHDAVLREPPTARRKDRHEETVTPCGSRDSSSLCGGHRSCRRPRSHAVGTDPVAGGASRTCSQTRDQASIPSDYPERHRPRRLRSMRRPLQQSSRGGTKLAGSMCRQWLSCEPSHFGCRPAHESIGAQRADSSLP